jgi:signal transduction histidine kinase
MRLAELIDPADWTATRQTLADIREASQAGDIENRVVTASGITIEMLWRVNWSAAEKNFFCVAHDITARRELERLKLEFMSMITHDIRSPINSVQAFLSMMSERVYGDLNEKGWQRLRAVEQSVDLVSKLITDLLDLEKAESGMLVLERDDTLSTRVIANSINIVRNLAERKNINLLQEGPQFDLFVDESRMIQVLVNLISNAIKFSPPNSAVTVSCAQVGEQAVFRVQDEGPGIKPEFQSRIFDRFEQLLDRGGTSESESEVNERVRRVKGSAGSGLGLAIAKAIVEAHGGQISVVSDGVRGTAFVVKVSS